MKEEKKTKPKIRKRIYQKPRCKPDKFGRTGWIISIASRPELFYFFGTENQAEKFRGLTGYKNKTKGYKRYATKKEIEQQKADRGIEEKEQIYTEWTRPKTFVTYMHESGLNITKEEADRAYAKASNRLALNDKLSKVHKEKRDKGFKTTRQHRFSPKK